MQGNHTPVARGLYVCDHQFSSEKDKVDLYGICNAIRPVSGYPSRTAALTVFAQLVDGFGKVPFRVDISDASNYRPIYTTQPAEMEFPNRLSVRYLAVRINQVIFPRPGVYIVELVCNNEFVADTPLTLL